MLVRRITMVYFCQKFCSHNMNEYFLFQFYKWLSSYNYVTDTALGFQLKKWTHTCLAKQWPTPPSLRETGVTDFQTPPLLTIVLPSCHWNVPISSQLHTLRNLSSLWHLTSPAIMTTAYCKRDLSRWCMQRAVSVTRGSKRRGIKIARSFYDSAVLYWSLGPVSTIRWIWALREGIREWGLRLQIISSVKLYHRSAVPR